MINILFKLCINKEKNQLIQRFLKEKNRIFNKSLTELSLGF